MKKVIIVHRWEGGPHDDWRPWLITRLEEKGYHVTAPSMPDTQHPVIEKWVETLGQLTGTPDKNTYFVGHSIGCQAILRYLETLNKPIGGAVFVAGWFNLEHLESPEVQRIADPWITTPLDIEKIEAILPRATLIISDNDPYGNFEDNKNKFSKIVTKEIVVPNARHFTKEDGYTAMPIIVDELERFSS